VLRHIGIYFISLDAQASNFTIRKANYFTFAAGQNISLKIVRIKALWPLIISLTEPFIDEILEQFNERSLLCAFWVRGCADYGKGCALSTIEVCKQQEHTEPSPMLQGVCISG